MTFFCYVAAMKDENARIQRKVWGGSHLFICWNKENKRYEWNDGIEWEANVPELTAQDWRLYEEAECT